jgi:hypothetical protein
MSSHDRHLCEACRQNEYEEYAHQCVHEAIEQNQLWIERFGIRNLPRWDYSLEDCTLTFSREGQAKVICDIVAVGSVQGSSWQWSWGNKNLPATCKARMDEVRSFGEEKQWSKLASPFLNSSDYVGWECASVTFHLLNGIATYRCPDSETPGYFMYLVILSSHFVN